MSAQEPDRDRAIEAMLRQTLRGSTAAESRDRCLDADTLAAWIDGDLKAADVAAAEGHLSTCARCQAMVAALVRATPVVQQAVPWWRRGWVIGSLVPLTAGAVAIAIWIASPDTTRNSAPAQDVPAVEAKAPVAPPSSTVAVKAPAAATAPPSADGSSLNQVAAAPQKPAAFADRRSAPPASEARSDAADRERAKEKDDIAKSPRRDEGFAAPAPSAARAAAAPAAPPAAAAADALGARGALVLDQQTVLKHAVTATEVLSPNPSIRWRIGASGSIERSGNGATTWARSSSGVTEDLTAGAAPSPTVCWIVGRRGTVLLSIDGLQWRRLAFPESVDLVAVQASDASAATVTTADNRRFRTADSGQTWTLLQEF